MVIDASVVANVIGDDGPDGEVARTAVRDAGELAAPDLVDVQTVAVLRKRWLAGTLTDDRFEAAIGDLMDLAIDRYPVLPLMARALELRSEVTPYDAGYIALAEVLRVPLVTADERLGRAPGTRCEVRSLLG